jgi:septum formation protein
VTGRPRLILASASPSRLATLRSAGLRPEVTVSGVAEDVLDGEAPAATALRLAGRKADAVAARTAADPSHPGPVLVLGCDSVLELDGAGLGKPGSPQVAVDRWRAMRGRSGVLHTGHWLIRLDPAPGRSRAGARHVAAVASTVVRFGYPSDAEIDAYVATGEPVAVAGGFTLEGLGAAFVRGVDGDPSNVVGVSVPVLRELAGQLGVHWPDLWHLPGREPDPPASAHQRTT